MWEYNPCQQGKEKIMLRPLSFEALAYKWDGARQKNRCCLILGTVSIYYVLSYTSYCTAPRSRGEPLNSRSETILPGRPHVHKLNAGSVVEPDVLVQWRRLRPIVRNRLPDKELGILFLNDYGFPDLGPIPTQLVMKPVCQPRPQTLTIHSEC